MTKLALIGAIVALSLCSAANPVGAQPANPPTISKAEFDQLKIGMTYAAVVAIIGSEGELLTETQTRGGLIKVYSWQGEGAEGASAIAMFGNGKMTTKSQSRLQ